MQDSNAQTALASLTDKLTKFYNAAITRKKVDNDTAIAIVKLLYALLSGDDSDSISFRDITRHHPHGSPKKGVWVGKLHKHNANQEEADYHILFRFAILYHDLEQQRIRQDNNNNKVDEQLVAEWVTYKQLVRARWRLWSKSVAIASAATAGAGANAGAGADVAASADAWLASTGNLQ